MRKLIFFSMLVACMMVAVIAALPAVAVTGPMAESYETLPGYDNTSSQAMVDKQMIVKEVFFLDPTDRIGHAAEILGNNNNDFKTVMTTQATYRAAVKHGNTAVLRI